jgi:hypothetical protein
MKGDQDGWSEPNVKTSRKMVGSMTRCMRMGRVSVRSCVLERVLTGLESGSRSLGTPPTAVPEIDCSVKRTRLWPPNNVI